MKHANGLPINTNESFKELAGNSEISILNNDNVK
jgi:hypothetical protein